MAPSAANENRNGKSPSNMTSADRARRDLNIVALVRSGVPPEAVAVENGVSKRTVHRLVAAYEGRLPDLLDIDAKREVRRVLGAYEQAISDLALLARREDTKPAVRVSAMRTRLEAERGRLDILQALGPVPEDLAAVRAWDQWQAVGQQIINVLDAFGVDEEVQNAIMDAVAGRPVRLPEGRQLRPAGAVDATAERTQVE